MNRPPSHPSPAAVERGAEFLAPGPRLKLVSFRAITRGGLRGYACVEFNGLRLKDVPLFAGHKGPWAGVPTKPHVRDGRHLTDDNGRLAYSPICEWSTPAQAEAFSKAVVELVERAHPGALG